jgi:hypothetical protein
VIPPSYRAALHGAGIDADGGRPLPDWDAGSAIALMDPISTPPPAPCRSPTPGTAFLSDPAEAAALAREINDDVAALVVEHPQRFGFLASLPMPEVSEAATEAAHALDDLAADGVVLLANARGTYLGTEGQDALFKVLDGDSAAVLVHPAELPAAAVPGIPPFAADFLLATSRAAFQLVQNGIVRRSAHPFRAQPCRRVRAVRVAPDGDDDRPRHRSRPARRARGLHPFRFDTALSRALRRCPPCWRSPSPTTWCSAATGPTHPPAWSSTLPTAWTSTRAWTLPRRTAINRDNAASLFPRLAGRTGT